jgi:hypothetical protein
MNGEVKGVRAKGRGQGAGDRGDLSNGISLEIQVVQNDQNGGKRIIHGQHGRHGQMGES